MNITRWSILKSDWLYFCSQRCRSSMQSAKTRLGGDCGSDHELLIAKFRLKLKKVRKTTTPFSSVQFSSVTQLCPTLRPHASQHSRPPCPSPTPGVYSNSCPSSWWCHPAISSSMVPFSSCPQSLPASGSFPMSQLFAWSSQRIGVSGSASALPMNTQDWSPLGWTGGSPCCPRDSQESSPTPQFKSINSSVLSFLHGPTLTSIHDHWKNHNLD